MFYQENARFSAFFTHIHLSYNEMARQKILERDRLGFF